MARAQPESSDHPIDRLVGDSPGIYALRAHIRHLAAFDTVGNPSVPTLLLHGETGTGKGLVARIIHDSGPRAHGAFIEINCAAIPETLLEAELFGFEAGAFTDAKRSKPGLFEAASGGTLFLDEVDTLPLPLQGKFLTAIEEKRVRRIGAMAAHPVDIKLLVATQADLSARVAEGRFRADLYYRLAVILLEIPPLRERGGDIVVLARHFLRRYAEAHRLGPKRLSGAAEVWLQGQSWPGNVRELSHLMERITLLAPEAVLTPEALERLCLPRLRAADRASPEWGGRKRHPRDERAWISQALRQTEGNVVQAAQLLGLSRSAMRYRMRRYGIGRPGREELTPLRAVSTTSLPSRPLPFQGSGPGEEGSDHRDHTRALSTPGEACGQDGGWEQKPVAVLVISVTFPAATAPELPRFDPWTLTARWEQCMTEKVTSFGGVLLASTPPLLTAAFGLPHTLDQLPHRAVQAALAIRHLLLEARRFDAREPCPEVRLAIHLGPLLADVQARASAARALAMGETLTLPVQLLGHAAPGDILVSSEVAGLIEGWFELQARQVSLGRGMSAESVVYTVAGLRPRQVPRARLGTRVHARFVGRERELAVLRDLQAQVEGGRGQVVGVIGEPGVGKSRLFYEFTRCHRAHPWLLLESTALSYGKTTAYLPVTNLLRAYFQLEEHDEGPRIGEQVAQQLLRLDEASRPDLPAVLTVLNLPVEDPQWQACNPPHRRQRILDALTRLLLRASQVQPVLLLLEDLQWIDTETQALLDRVIDSLPTARILLLVNYRPEYQHGWAGKSSYTQIRLDPLPPQHADALLQALLGDGTELAPLKQRLIDWTDGNPFFLEESVRTLVETQVLVGERGAYRLAGPPQNVRVPASVQAVLAARIDRLSAEAKDLLQSAAIIGRHVPFPLLQAVTALPEESLRRGLRHLQATEFLYETPLFRELTYTFKHALTQEVAYGSLPERRRCAYHTAIGSRLEELYAGRLDEVVELLAFHFGRSAEAEKAIDYAMLAAEKAQQRWAHVEALAHFEAARQWLEVMPDTDPNRLRRLDAVLKQGEVRFALGQHTEHIEALEGIHALVDGSADPRRRATWAYWMGFLHSFTGSRPDVAIAYCREASAIADAGGFDEIQALAESCLAQVYVLAGNLRGAVAAGERALAAFEAHGNVWWACRTLWHLSTAANALGEWGRGLQYCHRALEHGRAVDDLRLKVVGWWRTGSTHIQRGDPTTGLQCCDEALALSPIPYDAAMIRAVRGHGLVKVGETEAGTTELVEAVAWFDRSHLRYTRSVFALRLGEAYLRQGQWWRARASFEEVLAISQEAGYRHLEGVAERFLGESFMTEDPAAAAEHLEAAAQVLDEVGARNEVAKVLVAQATLRRAAGHLAGARQLLERALALFEMLGTLDEPHRVRTALCDL